MKIKTLQFCFIATVLILLLSGCKTIRGGGWIESSTGEGKATFGINITKKKCKYYGGFTYHDHGKMYETADGKMQHLSLKAWVDTNSPLLAGGGCDNQSLDDQSLENHITYDFTYQARYDKSGEEGYGTIEFWDANRSKSADEKDRLCINIYFGPYAGYSNCNYLGGGNLTIF